MQPRPKLLTPPRHAAGSCLESKPEPLQALCTPTAHDLTRPQPPISPEQPAPSYVASSSKENPRRPTRESGAATPTGPGGGRPCRGGPPATAPTGNRPARTPQVQPGVSSRTRTGEFRLAYAPIRQAPQLPEVLPC